MPGPDPKCDPENPDPAARSKDALDLLEVVDDENNPWRVYTRQRAGRSRGRVPFKPGRLKTILFPALCGRGSDS